jgi:hypothetical protein
MNNFNLTIPKEVAGKALHFETFEAFQVWLNTEQAVYDWLPKLRKNIANHVHAHVTQQFRVAVSQVQAIQRVVGQNGQIQGHLDSLAQWFQEAYKNKKLILSTSSDFKAMLEVENELRRAVFLGHMLSVPNLYSNGIEATEVIDGANEYFQYKNGLSSKDLSAEKAALQNLKSEWDSHLTNYKLQEDDLRKQFDSHRKNFEVFYKQSQNNIELHIKEHTDALDELKKTYDQFMALKAPVDYWTKKQNEHARKVSLFRNWVIGVGILGGAGLLWAVHHIFAADNKIDYWKIGFFILLGTLFFWTMRVLVKLLLSNIHLEGDANERVVMSQTYLALLREQSGLNDNDKKLILSSLFRPGTSGIVGDDGIPPGIYDMVSKLASK